MSDAFALNAYEQLLRRATALDGQIVSTTFVNGAGQMILDCDLRIGLESTERVRFLVRGHSVVEMALTDPRGRPAAAKRIRLS